jgi:hypothetical protein
VDGKTNNPAEAQVFINTIEHKKKELPFRTNRAGNFFKVLDPGVYSFMVKLKDGRGAQIQINMNGQPQSTVVTVP